MIKKLAMDKAMDAAGGIAAGVLYVAPDGDVLLLRRSSIETNYAGHWALPGGKGEEGETPQQTATREAIEEMGSLIPESANGLKQMAQKTTPTGMTFFTFAQSVPTKFVPTLNDEHSGYAWASIDQLPGPMHPSVYESIASFLGFAENVTPEDWAMSKIKLVDWLHQEEVITKPTTASDSIAMDRSSVRRTDDDGHLFVEMTPISKANVCPYFGREIPDFEALGLKPDETYKLYRDPEELAKAATSFDGKPLLLIHTPISADEHPREVVVGSIGNGVVFKAPYLMAPLNIWDGEAISLIENDKQKELSCGYRYVADMTPGTAGGEAYDGVMRNIGGNHVALVKEGRAGPDVVVGDSKQELPMKKTTLLSRKAIAAHGALMVHLKPKMAQDAKIDLMPALDGITAKNFVSNRAQILAGVKKAAKGKLAQDADLDLEELVDLLEVVQEMTPDDDDTVEAVDETPANGTKRDFLKGKLSAEDMKAWDEMDDDAEAMDEKDEDEKDKDKDKDKKAEDEEKPAVSKKAMDAAIEKRVRMAQDEMRQSQRDTREAEETVRPYIGKLAMAHDSAEDVYRTALSVLGVDTAEFGGLPASALKAVLKAQPLPNSTAVPAPKITMDAKAANAFTEMYPGYKPVKTL